MAHPFHNRLSWKPSLAVSLLVHSVGLSSLFAIPVPVFRTIALRQGQTAVEAMVIEASASDESDVTFVVEFPQEQSAVSNEHRHAIEPTRIEPRIFEDSRRVIRFDPQASSTYLETPETTVAMVKSLPKRPILDEEIVEIAEPKKRNLPRPAIAMPTTIRSSVPLPNYQLSGVVELPLRVPLKTNEPPKYPLTELVNGIEGRVVLQLTVEANGRVSAVTVETSSGVDGLDRAAVEAVSKWSFEPVQTSVGSGPEVLLAPIAFKIAGK